MAMTSLSIVLTVFVLQLHHVGPHQKPVPRWIKRLVIDFIAKAICMRSHLKNFYQYPEQARKDEVCLTSFIDRVDYNEKNNCNGRLTQKEIDITQIYPNKDRNVSYDRISKHLRILVSKHDSEDQFQNIINEWRLVAHIMDRFLFWLFLLGSLVSSLTILVFQPMAKPTLV